MSQSKILVFLATAFTFIAVPLSAHADFAKTTQNVNLRTGPGTEYDRVATLASGLRVDVLKCQPDWCRVAGKGIRGWVSAGYLTRVVVKKPVVVLRPVIVVRPVVVVQKPVRPRPNRPKCKIAPGFSCK